MRMTLRISWRRAIIIGLLSLGVLVGLTAALVTHVNALESISRVLIRARVFDKDINWSAPVASYWLQLFILLVMGSFLAIVHGSFVKPLGRYLHDHLVQALLFALMVGLVWGFVGSEFGFPDVIWGGTMLQRFLSGLAATLVMALLGINAYYLDDRPSQTNREIRGFLHFWLAPVPGTAPNLVAEMGLELERFLRVGRLPFLMVLVVPAVFTGFFTSVPRLEVRFLDPSSPWWFLQSDLLGLGVWSLGIFGGVVLVKGFLWASIRLGPYVNKLGEAVSGVSQEFGKQSVRVSRFYKKRSGRAWGWVLDRWYAIVPESRLDITPVRRQRRPSMSDPRFLARRRALLSFTSVFGMFYVLTATAFSSQVSPGLAVFGLLGMTIAIDGLVRLLVSYRWRVQWLGLILLWVAFANQAVFKLKFDNLTYDDRGRVELARNDPRIEESSTDRLDQRILTPIMDGQKLVSNQKSLDAWRLAWDDRSPAHSTKKPKLTVVACSGGGVRGAHWAATVLDWLDTELKEEHFRESLRVISASSASSVGAGYYVRRLYDQSPATLTPNELRLPDDSTWLDRLPTRSLDTIAPAIALSDVPHIPFLYDNTVPVDRGKHLEMTWDYLRDLPLDEVRELERTAELPSLVFCPILVEDGRRLFVSNLDLSQEARPEAPATEKTRPARKPNPRNLAVQRGNSMVISPEIIESLKTERDETRQPKYPDLINLVTLIEQGLDLLPGEVQDRALPEDLSSLRDFEPVLSVSGFEFTKLFARERGFRMATAARMSATFPLITPAVYLPTRPAVRVVDSGYRDNYGVELAADWIFQNREWLQEKTSGVALIQIRCFSDPEDRRHPPRRSGDWLARGFQFLWSVPQAAANTFATGALIRNDRLLSQLGAVLNKDRKESLEPFFTTVVFELPSFVRRSPGPLAWPGVPDDLTWRKWEASSGAISWSLTDSEAEAIHKVALPRKALADQFGIDEAANEKVIRDLEAAIKKAGPESRPALLWESERARNYQRLLALRRWWKSNLPGP